ncbi:helix-turn-helix transcriptional regulator [Facklamia lactis]|uniref:helix-turn-helix transcriptional regulator n=1 Tax=Facklamia lactis TaxID=2749967 RepID=UPI0018CE1094|nr:AraC family transcriptional regulator [Facklamia lactis]MBG9981062.1 helix-turn-helix transcriptional regulator [Facklamia lactis]
MIPIKPTPSSLNCEDCHLCQKFNPIGKTSLIDQEDYQGNLWHYETATFSLTIHDLFIKENIVFNSMAADASSTSLESTYLLSAKGEWLQPYHSIESNSLYIHSASRPLPSFVLHRQALWLSLNILFKEPLIAQYWDRPLEAFDPSQPIVKTNPALAQKIGPIAQEIIHCSMCPTASHLFFEAKSKEWLSITLQALMQEQEEKPLKHNDREAIEKVAAYINNHYASEIPQKLLEDIALMSGTKLKTTFKKHFHMSITEYTQRKRINIAENLLLTTDMEIKDIAKSVGYQSASRLTTLFKRYKGIHSKDVRKIAQTNEAPVHQCPKASQQIQ